jgi:hypothetical protein
MRYALLFHLRPRRPNCRSERKPLRLPLQLRKTRLSFDLSS